MITAVIFDCFGVLTTDLWRAYIDDLPDNVDVERAREVHRAYAAGLVSYTDMLEEIKDITGSTPPDSENGGQGVKNKALLKWIEVLSKQYKIGLLSNIGNNWVREELLTPDEQLLFSAMIFSYEVGMTKPNPSVYHLACEKLGVKPEQTIFVDDIESYCQAARNEGLQAVVYESFSQTKRDVEALLYPA